MSSSDQPVSKRATLKRNAGRAEYNQTEIRGILAAERVCHVAYVADGEPRLIPTLYMCMNDHLYLHGNRTSALLNHIADGGEVCVSVMIFS